MPLLELFESWAEGLLRIGIGGGLAWIGAAEGGGYGLFLVIVGVIFVVAGLVEIWSVEAAVRRVRSNSEHTAHSPVPVACDIPVFYATTHGQTRRIAENLVATFRGKGFTSCALDVARPDAIRVDWDHTEATVVIASLHAQKHQRAAAAFCRQSAHYLNRRPSVFLSVSLAIASDDAKERSEAARIAQEFVNKAAWTSAKVICLAGRLAYTHYGWLTRVVMTRIARRHGQPTDTTRDYEFTNWDEVARIADDIVRRIAGGQTRSVA